MSPLGWMGAGAGVVALAGLAFFLVTEREFRTAIVQVLAALTLGPALLIGAIVRGRSPRALRLSPAALARFAAQSSGGPRESAWLLAYRGRGVILVTRRRGSEWLNDVPNRASRGRREVAREQARPVARVRDDE